MSTKIEWTRGDDGTPGTTWNPVTGCTKVSPGCKHCYAETIAKRFWAKQYPPVPSGRVLDFRARRFTDVQTHADRLDQPLRWRSPKRVFVNSMSDLFHEDVSDSFIWQVFNVMRRAEQHTFQVLTKRPERALDWFRFIRPTVEAGAFPWPLPNVHLGVSCENQETADERIPLLLQTPAAVRFVSAEPLLAPVDLRIGRWLPAIGGPKVNLSRPWEGPPPSLDWCIVGGESGPGARPMYLSWARSIVEQCRAAGVACFVKQLGARPYDTMKVPFHSFEHWVAKAQTWLHVTDRCIDACGRECAIGADFMRARDQGTFPVAIYRRLPLRDRKGGDMEEWPEDLRVREFPT